MQSPIAPDPEGAPWAPPPVPPRLATFDRAVLALIGLPLLALLLLYLFIGDTTWWGEWLTVWPPLLWLAPTAPLAVLPLLRRKCKALAIALALLAAHGAVWTEWRPLIRELMPPPEDQPGDVVLATWNVAIGGGGLGAVLQSLEAYPEADVWLLQEAPEPDEADVAALLVGRWSDYQWASAGDCAVLSRLPLEDLGAPDIDGWWPAQVLRVGEPGRDFILVNVHLMLPALVLDITSRGAREKLRESATQRARQYFELGALARSLRDNHELPVVVGGDFNTCPQSRHYVPLRRAGLRDAWPAAGRGRGATMSADRRLARIDQFWTTSGLKPASATVLPEGRSDHRGVRMVVRPAHGNR